MACDKQEEEEQALAREREIAFSQDSEDIIYGSQEDIDMEPNENPFLAAQARKNMANDSKTTLTPKMGGTWNPFKKSTTPSAVSSR